MAREKLGSTGLGKGFALPHARPLLLTARLIQQALHLIMEPSLPFWRSDAPAVTGTDELIDVDQCGEKPDIH
jgi:hypothetical protein